MKTYAIIGYPLGHTLSPNIHERLFNLSGKEANYVKMEIPPEELEAKFGELAALGGFNITIPHKVPIIKYCDRLDEGAARYGSVNCLKNGDEKVGYNTDVLGFTKSIDLMGASLASKVLLIGCGGVGRMMAIETALSGGDLTIAVLKKDEASTQAVIDEIKKMKPDAKVQIVFIGGNVIAAEDFSEKPCFDLIVNASPIGMFPKVENMPCDENLLENVKFVFDVVYNPRDTLLVKTAEKHGIKAMSGMAMLVLQAVAAHEIWYGAKFTKEQIDELISDASAAVSEMF